MNRNSYFNLKELKERGWTDSKILLWLKEPDELRKNPFYKSAGLQKLYLIERVIEQENTEMFLEWKNKSIIKREKLSNAQLKIHEKKREELFQYINDLNIEIGKEHKTALYKRAVNHYNNLWVSRGNYDKFIVYDKSLEETEFFNRITINMLRHENEHYEEELYNMFGKTGNNEAYFLLKERIYNEIIKVYPFLGKEN
jgi:hypothetical protein